ncbi:hypothetical protein GXM_03545 [Nostoc sphaeroides CCNUC1]|uniref:Uncharacterized protein n=1 Tax=Nostoc sphaeroides CCNUC1 TaxID=2653204 RepID=A0A5P8W020_9NOSO|nr:hypothetical protein GXM_03545 [Nostoc sphaeroides CCNUC1]
MLSKVFSLAIHPLFFWYGVGVLLGRLGRRCASQVIETVHS